MRAIIKANAHLAGMARGETREVELTDWQLKRAANGQVSIVESWGDEPEEEPVDEGPDPGPDPDPEEVDEWEA